MSHCVYTKGGVERGWGKNDEVRYDLFPSPTLPSDRSLGRSGDGNPPHHFGSPALTDAPPIYFPFTDKYLYAGSNDVEFIGQALW
jgi:hypothetical protein